MTLQETKELLESVRAGTASIHEAVRRLQSAPIQDLGFAKVDTHRALRKGFPEVVFCAGKTADQILKITEKLLANDKHILLTRVSIEQARPITRRFKKAKWHEAARCITIDMAKRKVRPGTITVLCAGTSDLPVAEEASVTAEVMGNKVTRIYDVGVAGLHRLLSRLDEISTANVIVVVAGMEGALPSVVCGLVSKPVIAVPTSIGYGASLGGLAALLSMLNSCSSGVTVVNIDNGFGAGYAASQINALAAGESL